MKFYLASKWEQYRESHELCTELEGFGHVCSHNWMDIARGVEENGATEESLPGSARADIVGVLEADILILDARGKGGQGRWVEFGVALASEKPVIAWTDSETKVGVFFYHPGVHLAQSKRHLIRLVNGFATTLETGL